MPLTPEEVTSAVITEVRRRLDACVEQIAHCLAQLSEEQVWWRPHESMNSIGNLVLHLAGNVRQEIICLTRMQLGDRYQFDWIPSTPEEGAP